MVLRWNTIPGQHFPRIWGPNYCPHTSSTSTLAIERSRTPFKRLCIICIYTQFCFMRLEFRNFFLSLCMYELQTQCLIEVLCFFLSWGWHLINFTKTKILLLNFNMIMILWGDVCLSKSKLPSNENSCEGLCTSMLTLFLRKFSFTLVCSCVLSTMHLLSQEIFQNN